jgi:peptidoglycan/LPS O-acetylase OafA/YrhL
MDAVENQSSTSAGVSNPRIRNQVKTVMPTTDRPIPVCDSFVHRGSIPSLDGLSAISIGLVILGHAYVPTTLWGRLLFDHSALGVRIFFVISGYLITHLLLEEIKQFRNVSLTLFYARRALRILPAFLLFVAAWSFSINLASSAFRLGTCFIY